VGIVFDSPVLKAVPTAIRLAANCYPTFLTGVRKKTLSNEEEAKFLKIKNLIPKICDDLGIKEGGKVKLHIAPFGANAGMIGTTSSFGGPVLCLGNTYFNQFDSVKTDDLDYVEWLDLLEKMPNNPSDLGKYLDGCSENLRERIRNLAEKFKNVLSQDELESVLAHELGHAKHHHLLTNSGLILSYLAAEKVANVIANYLNLGRVFTIASLPMFFLTIYKISRFQEVEADGECAFQSRYQKGMLSFYKRGLIKDLFARTASHFEKEASRNLHSFEWFSSHPNHAKRLEHATQLSQHEHHTATAMTSVAWALAALGVVSLARDFFFDAKAIVWSA